VSDTTQLPLLWLSQADAARYLDVTDRTIRNYIARGDLPARRVRGSRLIRIARSDLDALLSPIPVGRAS
jgi:excisionase family DNA binding protein